jgi:uncharacterized SAM-binding protein YcdF (DUF218 family)
MFFVFSKCLAWLLNPLFWIVGLFLFYYFIKNTKQRERCLRLAFFLLVLMSNSFLFQEVIRAWEVPPLRNSDLECFDCGIVLGGVSVYQYEYQRPQFYRATDRLIHAVDLYKMGKIKKIIFSGGAGKILLPNMREGEYVKRYITMMGVLEDDILIDSLSRNTLENAVLTKKIIDRKGFSGKCLLITSAFHMRRSISCFKSVGLETVPYSTDIYSEPRNFRIETLLVPNASVLGDWNIIIHEFVGFGVYRMLGY